jgi:hypothetical protein
MYIHRFINEYLDLLFYVYNLRYSFNRYEYFSKQIKTEIQIALGRLLELKDMLLKYFSIELCDNYGY